MHCKDLFSNHLHEDGNRENADNASSAMHSDGIDRIVNPESNEKAGQEKIGRGSNGGDDARRPRSKEVAAGAEGDHPCYGAVDGPDEGVGARENFVDEETDYSCCAARHLRRMGDNPTPRNALSVSSSIGPLVRHVFYPHLTHTHTNLISECAR